jgi:hypothetical protein
MHWNRPVDKRSRPARAGWLKKIGFGMAAVAGVVILAAGALITVTFRGYARGYATERELANETGAAAGYVVPQDGSLPPDRLARFIRVREGLAPLCGGVQQITDPLKRVPELAAQDPPDLGGLLGKAAETLRRFPTVGLVFGRYVEARNQALLAERMGLGEYTWIYVVTYFAYLGQSPVGVLESPTRPTVFVDRIYPETAGVIARHVEQAGLSGGPWVEELARLRADPSRVPFAGTLPPELAASIAPHRSALLAASCPDAAELDLVHTVPRSVMGYDHR